MQFKDFVGYPYDREKPEEYARLDDAIRVQVWPEDRLAQRSKEWNEAEQQRPESK